MNKKVSKTLSIVLSAAMAASAFAMGTSSAFAAPTPESAKVTLAAAKSVPLYLWNNNSTHVDIADALNSSTAQVFNGAKFTDEAGNELGVSDPYANLDDAKFTEGTDNENVTMVDNGEIWVSSVGDEGDSQIVISGLQITDDEGDKYIVDDITLPVKVIDEDDVTEAVWSTSDLTNDDQVASINVTDEVSVGDTVYLNEVKAGQAQDGTHFARRDYTKMNAVTTPTAGSFDKGSVSPAGTLKVNDTNSTMTAMKPGTATADYYPSNANAPETPAAVKTPELTIKGEYNDVTDIEKQADGTYTVTTSAGKYTGLTANDLANATFNLADGAKTITDLTTANGVTNANGTIAIDTKLGTVVAHDDQDSLTVEGVEIDTIKNGAVTVLSSQNQTSHANIPASVGTIDTAGTVIIGDGSDNTKNYDTITVDTVKANTIQVNTNKAKIGAITAKSTAGTISVDDNAKNVELPALDGYKLVLRADATVASIDNGGETALQGHTLTVSGTATFTGNVGKNGDKGTIAIAPDSLTIKGTTNDKFILTMTGGANAGDVAFTTTSTSVNENDYTDMDTDSESSGVGAVKNIVTPGYTAVVNADGEAIIDQTIVAGGITNATEGAVYNPQTGMYDLEINDDEAVTLALQPINADALSVDQKITWTLTCTSNNITLNNLTTGSAQEERGLTAVIVGNYVKDYSNYNTATVKAEMEGTNSSVTYNIKIVNERTTPTTDFSLTTSATYVMPGDTIDVYANPNGNQKMTEVRFSSSDPSIATVTGGSAVNNYWKATVSGHKDGTATITAVATLQDGTQVTHTTDVVVATTPVLAYVDGVMVGPNDTIDVVQSTSKDITFFSATGATIDTFDYTTGNDKVGQTDTVTAWNGTSGLYQIYANGAVGSSTGLYVNGQKVFMINVIDRPFTADTTIDIVKHVGDSYIFGVTPNDPNATYTFSTANGSAIDTSVVQGAYPDADGTYYGKLTIKKAVGEVGVYCQINGVTYKVFTINTQA